MLMDALRSKRSGPLVDRLTSDAALTHRSAARPTSSSERPRDHHRELLPPEGVAVRPGTLLHDHLRATTRQSRGPPLRVLEEEGLLGAGDEVRPRESARHRYGRPIARARRCAEDGPEELRVTHGQGQSQLCARRDTERGRPFAGQRHPEPGLRPASYLLDEEGLVRREPLRIESGRVLVEPHGLVGCPVDPHHHGGWHIGCLEVSSPRRHELTVPREHDRLGRLRGDVRRHLPAAVVVERLGDELAGPSTDVRSLFHTTPPGCWVATTPSPNPRLAPALAPEAGS